MDFSKKPILGMIHLSGDKSVFLERAMEEIAIFEQEGVDGIIVENYHGDVDDMRKVLSQLNDYNGILGLNVLPNEYQVAFEMANEYKASFIQLDYIAGVYESFKSFKYITEQHYLEVKKQYPNIAVLGGVWPKYYQPIKGSNLNTDIEIGMKRAEAIVVTGQGTGKETPIDKVAEFKNIMGNFPLIVGAGVTTSTVHRYLSLSDGIIVGSAFKPYNNTTSKVSKTLVREFMSEVKNARSGK